MALIECNECKKEISDKAESCPHCGAPIKIAKTQLPKKWYQRTSVTLCFTAIIIIVAFGFVHIITGVTSPIGLPFDLALIWIIILPIDACFDFQRILT